LVLSRVRLIRVKFVLVNLNPINDTYKRLDRVYHKLGNAPVLRSGTGSWVLSG